MSEPKLISPMLDNFVMGEPISDRNGVACCPAIEKETNNKYIVKIISTPASQKQLDALLLTGAYASKEEAQSYFKVITEEMTEEFETLKRLSKLEGFIAYSDYQIEPMDNEECGYNLYLLGEYKQTLSQFYRKGSMTHLAAINLGLDLCAALAVCRRLGYLYVDLKPENIYMISDREFRIGDLGFIKLDTLKYTSLPDRYRSQYTAPEIADAFSALNTTVDVYAAGLILYQAFNDGKLPFNEESAPSEEFLAPAYADYEMAEIILKACAPEPENRWQDPIEMGQALVSYMQRNGAHDTPIVPVPAAPEEAAPDSTLEATEESICTSDEQADLQMADTIEESTQQDDSAPVETEQASVSSTPVDENEVIGKYENVESMSGADTEECDGSSTVEQPSEEAIEEILNVTEDSIFTEDEEGNLTFISEDTGDETIPSEEDGEIDYQEVSNEVSEILNQADDLLSHPTPEPVIQPEPVDVPIPPPIQPEEPEIDGTEEPQEEIPLDNTAEDIDDNKESDEPANDNDPAPAEDTVTQESIDRVQEDTSDEEEENNGIPKKKIHWVRSLFIALITLGLLAVGIYYYRNYYIQPIDSMVLEESKNGSLTVLIESPIPEDKLTVYCLDTYGNQQSSSVVDGKATFTNLAPDSAFKIRVDISGFHKLTGDTSTAFTTPSQTEIVQFNAVTGAEDGSAILGFAVEGPDSDQWKLSYSNQNGENVEEIFSGHMITLTGLTIGNEYTFNLSPVDDLRIVGNTEVKHTAAKIVKATKVTIVGCVDNKLAVNWTAPEDTTVSSWTVRCYNDSGYDNTIVTGETSTVFDIEDSKGAYTVDVTASGNSVGERAYAAANSITVDNFSVSNDDPNNLKLTWEVLTKVDRNWIVLYSINNGSSQELACENTGSAIISPAIPGATYTFSLQTTDGDPILGGEVVHKCEDAQEFKGYAVSAKVMEFKMCKTPSYSGWDRYDLSKSDYTTTFEIGQKASYLIRMRSEYNTSNDEIVALFVVRDENGTIVNSSTSTNTWVKMWYKNYCELDIPSIPQVPGKYTMSVYFNGALANENSFTVVEE